MDELDLEKQAAEIGIDRSNLLSLYYIYINETEKDIKELIELTERGDREASRQMAHHIKGASLNLELSAIAEAALNFEKLCRSGEENGFSAALDSIESHFRHLKLLIAEEDSRG